MAKVFKFILDNWAAITAVGASLISWIAGIIIAVKKKQWGTLTKQAIEFMAEAEKFTHYSGAEKKAYVITKANQFAISKGLKFNEELMSTFIESEIEKTKHINMRDKDKAKNL